MRKTYAGTIAILVFALIVPIASALPVVFAVPPAALPMPEAQRNGLGQ